MIPRPRGSSRLTRAGLAAILVVGMLLPNLGSQANVNAGSEAIPDLSMAPVSDFHVQWVNGRRLLRFTAMFVNIGDGHFELSGHRNSASQPMIMRQVIYETSSHNSPVSRRITTKAVAQYSGDGHNHWHVQEMMRYDLWGDGELLRGAKVGFCFLDSDPYNLSLPGASSSYYRGSFCSTNPNALSNRMGISIGWGDKYPWDFAFQWIDITGLPSGEYTVRAKVDPYKFFLEQREANQCAYARVRLTANAVTVLSTGRTCVNDWTGTTFEADIAWMYANNITKGCAPDLYCPLDNVPRDEMASFLRKAFDVPWTAQDFFTDDEGNIHEGAINRVALAGITGGCGGTRFCPSRRVTRGEMAAFLSRALALPEATQDYFTDDDDNPHQDHINRIREAGVTTGCTATRFCPDGLVKRGQMAAFLHRAVGD